MSRIIVSASGRGGFACEFPEDFNLDLFDVLVAIGVIYRAIHDNSFVEEKRILFEGAAHV